MARIQRRCTGQAVVDGTSKETGIEKGGGRRKEKRTIETREAAWRWITRNWSPRKLDRTEKLDDLFRTLTSSGRVRITEIFLHAQRPCTLERGTRVPLREPSND